MLNVYLSGEIHTNWREEIIQLCEKEKLKINFSSPTTNHDASDNCGVEILGHEEKNFWKDNKGAKINSIKTKKSIKDCDVVIVKFGDKYKQWNAAFDADPWLLLTLTHLPPLMHADLHHYELPQLIYLKLKHIQHQRLHSIAYIFLQISLLPHHNL